MRIATYRNIAGRWDAPFDQALDGPATLVLLFAGSNQLDRAEPFADVSAAYPRARRMGCSTAGEILDTKIDDDTVTVAVAAFERSRVAIAEAPLPDTADSAAAGRALAGQLADTDLRAVFVLSTGLHVNGSELVRGLNADLPRGVVVTGGLAGDGSRFARTWVLAGDRPRQGYATAVGLYGSSLRVGHGSRGGWDIFGPQRLVTRSVGNVLYELDGRPALQLYKEYLGDLADGLPATGLRFPLAVRETRDSAKELVRTILAVDEDDQSIMFAGDIPQGALAQLMRANFDDLVAGAEDAARLAGSDLAAGPCLALAISCVGRRMVLGEGSEEEVEATRHALPPGTRQVGFYGYGELAPYTTGECDLHNQTMTLTTLQEA